MKKIKVGIFFGGPSREREISFAGGRTVYDNLNKTIFEPIPIFVDSFKSLILLDWEYIYKGTIRDFYPPVKFIPDSENNFQIYLESIKDLDDEKYQQLKSAVGRPLSYAELNNTIDVAFLALHGEYGEDGQIQSMLQSLGIPYTGSGILPCAIGMDKGVQKKLMNRAGYDCPSIIEIKRSELETINFVDLCSTVLDALGKSFVIRPANQGSSIGVSILHNPSLDEFIDKTLLAFFIKKITYAMWSSMTKENKVHFIRTISDLRDGLGFPMKVGDQTIYHPEQLLVAIHDHFIQKEDDLILESFHQEHTVIFESFIHGTEFSCIVIRGLDGKPIALPPTEIRKQGNLYDYKSKYLPGLSRKITPIDLEESTIERIRKECESLYEFLSFNTYARIDGFIQENGKIFLNDPNTTSGMLPSSFFFHQAAEIGLDPSQFISYVIRTSLEERKEELLYNQPGLNSLIKDLDNQLQKLQKPNLEKKKIAVILGGYSFERHISVESGRNIYEKLASSDAYLPTPIFLKKAGNDHELYQIPINLLLKDNADDISDKIQHFYRHLIIDRIKEESKDVTSKYQLGQSISSPKKISYQELAETFDAAFIALHGRPGEDGTVQERLKVVGLPYNGSHTESSRVTINKFETLQILKNHGFTVAKQMLLSRQEFIQSNEEAIRKVEQQFKYPFIAKPVDDGCSSAVVMIKDSAQFNDYLSAIFRREEDLSQDLRNKLRLGPNDEFPNKLEVLIEELITKSDAKHFLEITGGLLTHHSNNGIEFEVFEPSEALAGGEILSLEEKFLAGEGQNLTPARFGDDYETIATKVKADLERVARILHVEGYARIDAFVRIYDDNRVETIIIEVNSLPGMTPATCIFHQSAINGYKPYHFINQILQYALNE